MHNLHIQEIFHSLNQYGVPSGTVFLISGYLLTASFETVAMICPLGYGDYLAVLECDVARETEPQFGVHEADYRHAFDHIAVA